MRIRMTALVLAIAAALAVPSAANAAVIPADPNTACSSTSYTAAVGRWGYYKITETYYWPNASTVRIARVQTYVKSTHLAPRHVVDWVRVRITSNGSTAYDNTYPYDCAIYLAGSVTVNHYPNKYVSASSNSTGAALRYVGAVGTPYQEAVVTPFLWWHVGY